MWNPMEDGFVCIFSWLTPTTLDLYFCLEFGWKFQSATTPETPFWVNRRLQPIDHPAVKITGSQGEFWWISELSTMIKQANEHGISQTIVLKLVTGLVQWTDTQTCNIRKKNTRPLCSRCSLGQATESHYMKHRQNARHFMNFQAPKFDVWW